MQGLKQVKHYLTSCGNEALLLKPYINESQTKSTVSKALLQLPFPVSTTSFLTWRWVVTVSRPFL